MRVTLVCALLLGAGLSCRESTAPRPTAASLEIESGADQQGTVAAELSEPLMLRVLDAGGNPVEGQPVAFRVMAGGGSMLAGAAVSNVDGVVQARWTLGSRAGLQAVEAQTAGEATATPAVTVVHATAHADAPDTVRVVSGNDQTAVGRTALVDSLLVRVVDRFGNPTPGISVAWSVSANGGTLDQPSGATTDSGYTSVKLVAGSQAGDYAVVATAGARSASFTVHVTRPPRIVADLVGVYPLTTVDDERVPFVFFQPSERRNAILSGALEIRADGSTIRTESWSVTDFAGTTTRDPIERGMLVIKGDSVFVAGVPGVVTSTGIRLSRTVDAGFPAGYTGVLPVPPAGPGVTLEKVSGDAQSAITGAALANPVVVRVLDGTGRAVAGQTVRFLVTSGGGSVSSLLVATDADGLAQTRWTVGTRAGATQALDASITSTAAGVTSRTVSFAATASIGPAARIVLLNGDVGHLVVGDTIRLIARGFDQYDNDLSPTLVFESAPAGILSLVSMGNGSALFRGEQAGSATVTIRAAAGVTREVPIVVDAFGQLVFAVADEVRSIRRSGSRLVGIGGNVQEWNGRGFTRFVPGGASLQSIDASDDGRFWINGAAGWFSATQGTWSRLPQIPGPTPFTLSVAVADPDHVFTSVVDDQIRPSVFQLVGGAWVDLQFPQTIGDSAFGGVELASPDPATLLAFGRLEPVRFGGQYRPGAMQWTGGRWTQLAVPALPDGWTNGEMTTLSVDHRGGAVFGLLTGNVGSSGLAWKAFRIRSGVIELIDLPALAPGERVVNIGRTSTGQLVVVTGPGWWVRDESGWTRHLFLNGWTAVVGNGIVVDADGTTWIGVSRGGAYGVARITQP